MPDARREGNSARRGGFRILCLESTSAGLGWRVGIAFPSRYESSAIDPSNALAERER